MDSPLSIHHCNHWISKALPQELTRLTHYSNMWLAASRLKYTICFNRGCGVVIWMYCTLVYCSANLNQYNIFFVLFLPL